MELEGRFRRAAAERGAVELKKNEFQGELKKQMEQIEHIQSLHNAQLENTNKIHRDEKVRALFLYLPSSVPQLPAPFLLFVLMQGKEKVFWVWGAHGPLPIP